MKLESYLFPHLAQTSPGLAHAMLWLLALALLAVILAATVHHQATGISSLSPEMRMALSGARRHVRHLRFVLLGLALLALPVWIMGYVQGIMTPPLTEIVFRIFYSVVVLPLYLTLRLLESAFDVATAERTSTTDTDRFG